MSKEIVTNTTALEKVLPFLTPKEVHAYKYFLQARKNQPPAGSKGRGGFDTQLEELSPAKSLELYELFRNGKDCAEIQKLNSGLGYGQIIHARVRDDWDVQRQSHQQAVMTNSPSDIMVTQMEAAVLMKDALTAALKYNDEGIKKYIQTSDKAHLKGTFLESGASLNQIKGIVDLLKSLTGQDRVQKVEKTVHVTNDQPVQTVEAIKPDEHSSLLEQLAAEQAKTEAQKGKRP